MNLYRHDRRDVWLAVLLAVAGLAWLIAAGARGQSHPTLTQWLLARGLTRTQWVSGDRPGGGSQAFSTWHPDVTDSFEGRYGMTAAQRAIFAGYSGDTAGAHGDLVAHANEAIDALGIQRSGPAPFNPSASLDDFDLSMVAGATKALIAAAGLDQQPVPQPTATAAPTPTPRPPCLSPDCLPAATPTPTPQAPPPVATPTPPACPQCPVAPPCPVQVCPTCQRVPAGALDALRHVLAGDWVWLGRGRRAALAPLQTSTGLLSQCVGP